MRSAWQKFVALFQQSGVTLAKPEVQAKGVQHMKPELSIRSMFAAASYQFVKSVGKNTLQPVPSIDEKDNVKPFQLVVKSFKRKFIVFEKAVYRPTEFQLTDVMMDTEPLKTIPVTSELMSDYNRVSKISLKGKFGAEISKEILDAELEASDTISLNIKFGKVTKLEVKEPELLQELSQRRINLDHPYIQQIRQDKSKVLCLITGVAELPAGGSIHRDTELDATATLKASLVKGANVSSGGSRTNERDIGLAPLTPVAYNVHELNVDKHNGAMQLVLAKGSYGGFKDSVGYDEVDATCVSPGIQDAKHQQRKQIEIDLDHPLSIFKPLYDLPADTRTQLNTWLLYMMSIPRDMFLLSELIDDAEKGQTIQVKIADFKDKFLSTDDSWLQVLQLIGFREVDSHLTAPSQIDATFHAIGEFFDAATMLDDDVLDLIHEIPANKVKSLLCVIKEGIIGNPVRDMDILQPLIDNASCLKLLLELQFRIEDNIFQPPIELPYSIDEVYWILFALYWNV